MIIFSSENVTFSCQPSHENTSTDEMRDQVQLLVGLLGGIMGSIAGGGLTWLTTRWTLRRELEHGYDKELRAERVTAYKKLWQITGALRVSVLNREAAGGTTAAAGM
jgi:hypothetical protein